ncbi:transglutaminase family protein [Anatilimnocola sp. NA78]|uniref:transglutaminase-like domain-containing protein n=1 Tax=Anatilimnocola sp. NA78 TaxID=3415683 RepID=UPI003CE50F1A
MLARIIYCLAAVLSLSVSFPLLAAEPALDAKSDYRAERSNPVTYDIELAAIVTAPYHTHTLKVWLPIPTSDFAQEVTPGEISVFPSDVKPQIAVESVYGNKFAYFEFNDPQGAQIIRHRFRVRAYELHWKIDPAKVTEHSMWPDSFAAYLKGDQTVVVNGAIESQAKTIVGSERNPADNLSLIMQWMHGTMKYDHGQASLAASSLHALQTQTGHCSDYHGLCSAFGRALGYPTRVTYGLNTFPKNSPSHCKLEVFLPPYGWVSFDVSETQRLMQAIDKDSQLMPAQRKELQAAAFDRLKQGYRDNTWFLQTRGTGYDLVPPAKQKVNVVRTIYAEADGVALPEPDPADPKQTKLAWQIGLKVTADKEVKYPFSYGK